MKYRAKNTFNVGRSKFWRGKEYEEIPEGYEGYFDKVIEKKSLEIQGQKIETASIDNKPKRRKRKAKK